MFEDAAQEVATIDYRARLDALKTRAEGSAGRLLLFALYAALLTIAICAHVMWRDEIQAWLIARDSNGLAELFDNLRYEGHGSLWYLLLKPISAIGPDPQLMLPLHALISLSVVAIVLWRSPLSVPEKLIFPFGYFPLYEYGVKARGYSLGCLLLFVVCALWPLRRRHPILLSFTLALLANADILWMVVSIAAAAALLADRFISRENLRQSDLLCLLILLAGWIAAVATVLPPPDIGIHQGWLLDFSLDRLKKALGTLCVLLTPDRWSRAADFFALLVLLYLGSRHRNNLPVAIFLGASVAGLLLLFYAKGLGSQWHRGVLWTALFAAAWIDRTRPPKSNGSEPLIPRQLLFALLCCQAFSGVSAVWLDFYQPLSRGRDAASYISRQSWRNDPIVGVPDYAMTTVVGYLKKDHAYYPNARGWGSFTVWNRQRLTPLSAQEFLEVIKRFGSATWILSPDKEIEKAMLLRNGFKAVADFSGAQDTEENYVIYRR